MPPRHFDTNTLKVDIDGHPFDFAVQELVGEFPLPAELPATAVGFVKEITRDFGHAGIYERERVAITMELTQFNPAFVERLVNGIRTGAAFVGLQLVRGPGDPARHRVPMGHDTATPAGATGPGSTCNDCGALLDGAVFDHCPNPVCPGPCGNRRRARYHGLTDGMDDFDEARYFCDAVADLRRAGVMITDDARAAAMRVINEWINR